jgi:two-component system alkaline phosphatase synthesis response regulator PhoP
MNGKILIIDDEAKALALLKLAVESAGYEVTTATNGAEGMVWAIKNHPDIIVLDIKLPDIDGWEICNILKTISITSDIPIIFFTAFSGEKDIEKAKSLGADEYLTKPVDPERITRMFKIILQKKYGATNLLADSVANNNPTSKMETL